MNVPALIAFATLALAVPAPAAQRLAVDTVVTEYIFDKTSDYPKGSKVIARVHSVTESGKPMAVRAAGTEWVITPTLLRNGSVSYSESLILRYDSSKAHKVAMPKRKPEPLGEPYAMTIGLVEFSARTSIAK